MKKILYFILLLLVATPSLATIQRPKNIFEIFAEADVIAHVRPVRVEARIVDEKFCGYTYIADVVEGLHGVDDEKIEFTASSHTGNLAIGQEAVVFLRRAKWRDGFWVQFPLANKANEFAELEEICTDKTPSLFEMGYATMEYSTARARAITKDEFKLAASMGDNPEEWITWHDNFYMLRIPPTTDLGSLVGARKVSVHAVEIDGEILNIDDISDGWLLPEQYLRAVTLFPAREMKSIIREFKNLHKNQEN
ncbi:MAG: hypothetical protein DHS20C05_15820 [Hyphococcus sp.]|nr:MAG: hypothetical protein DHS20C05_15820 [Marinicaulis sp.]